MATQVQASIPGETSDWTMSRVLSEIKFRELLDNEDSTTMTTSVIVATTAGDTLTRILIRKYITWARDTLEKLPIRLTLENVGVFAIVLAVVMPRVVTYTMIYPMFRLVFGTLYPAYASYKAVRTKNVKEYVKWMMYWIVFALFTCVETFTDVFLSFWFPFYYEIKIILVLWLLSPATKGSSILYRRFVHPALCRREAEIDETIARATEQGYATFMQLGSKGVNYATTVLMQTAIKGGGGLVQHLRKSYSLSDLTGEKENVDGIAITEGPHDEVDFDEPRRRERIGRRGYSPRRTQSSTNHVDMYFSEVDLEVRKSRSREPVGSLSNIKSSEDISSGYSSGEALQSQRIISTNEQLPLIRTASVGTRSNRSKTRAIMKKVPEVGELLEEDEDFESINKPPHPLSLLTPDQTLEVLKFISQNKEYIRSLNQNLSDSEDDDDDSSTLTADSPDSKMCENKDRLIEKELVDAKIVLDQSKITGEMCSEKLDALKELIQVANKTVASIITPQPIPSLSDVKSNNSKSNSDSIERAGRYHKKPAPKAPTDDEENETEEKPVKATLVIKTGFTNNQAVNAVINKRRKVQEKKTAARESFTKLLTIPKNIFHNAFHRDDDTRSLSSRSRSGSRENVEALLSSANSSEDVTYISLKPDSIDSDIASLSENKEETETDV